MTAKQIVQQRLPTWSEEDAEIALRAVEHEQQLKPSGDSESTEPNTVGRPSFLAIGASGAPDVSERLDEYLGLAIDRRHHRT